MCLPKTWQARRVPVRFVSIISRQSSSGNVSVGARLILPALLTRMSTLPKRETVSASSFSRDPRSCMSQVRRRVARPRASISAAVSSTCSWRRAEATTSAPASASPRLMARPMPEVPPTTTAILPSSCKDLSISSPPHAPALAPAMVSRGLFPKRRARCAARRDSL